MHHLSIIVLSYLIISLVFWKVINPTSAIRISVKTHSDTIPIVVITALLFVWRGEQFNKNISKPQRTVVNTSLVIMIALESSVFSTGDKPV